MARRQGFPDQCIKCEKGSRYGTLSYCRKCALKSGYAECTTCSIVFAPEPAMGSTTRCYKCVVEKRRTKGTNASVRTVSGGLPTLGKKK